MIQEQYLSLLKEIRYKYWNRKIKLSLIEYEVRDGNISNFIQFDYWKFNE